MPRSFNAAAISRRLDAPSERMSSITGSRSATRFYAFSRRTLALAFTPLGFWLAMMPARSPPSFTPRALAAASAALRRWGWGEGKSWRFARRG